MIFAPIGNAGIVSMLMQNCSVQRQPYYQNPAVKKQKEDVKDSK